jgi:peptidoglycan hydrolase CwlO-like protein
MSTITDNDLKELKDLINSKFDTIDRKLEIISNDIIELKIDVATIKTEVNALNKRLDDTQSNMNKRVDGVEARLNILISVMFTGLLGIIAKLVFIK